MDFFSLLLQHFKEMRGNERGECSMEDAKNFLIQGVILEIERAQYVYVCMCFCVCACACVYLTFNIINEINQRF